VVAVVGSLLGLLLLADRCAGPSPGGGGDGEFFDAGRDGQDGLDLRVRTLRGRGYALEPAAARPAPG
jgi:hypothetical protein